MNLQIIMEPQGAEIIFESNVLVDSNQLNFGQDTFICGLCQSQFDELNNFLVHKQNCKLIIDDDFTENLENVDEEQEIIVEVEEMPLNENVILDKLSCKVCFKKFKKKYDLQQHLLIHTGENPFKCDICDKGFKQKSNLKRHARIHRFNVKKSNNFTEKIGFEVLTDTGRKIAIQATKSLKCEFCPNDFKSFHELLSHTATDHASEKMFKCLNCAENNVFDNFEDYSNHLKIIHDETPNPNCDLCQIEFESDEKLQSKPRKV